MDSIKYDLHDFLFCLQFVYANASALDSELIKAPKASVFSLKFAFICSLQEKDGILLAFQFNVMILCNYFTSVDEIFICYVITARH